MKPKTSTQMRRDAMLNDLIERATAKVEQYRRVMGSDLPLMILVQDWVWTALQFEDVQYLVLNGERFRVAIAHRQSVDFVGVTIDPGTRPGAVYTPSPEDLK